MKCSSLEGRPLFSYGLETLRRVAQLRPECEVTVVSRYPQILEAAQTAGVRAVDSPQSVGGISHTIRAALDALPPVSGDRKSTRLNSSHRSLSRMPSSA